jgi:hypothetical protein
MTEPDTIPCADCGAPLSRSNDGLDTYDEGYGILPDGCYRIGSAVCIDCYEKNFATCDGCEATVPADEVTDGYCGGCEPEYRLRFRVVFSAFHGGVDADEADDRAEARGIVAQYARSARRIGAPFVRLAPDRWEIQEPENCALVPPLCGTVAIQEYRRADRRRRR